MSSSSEQRPQGAGKRLWGALKEDTVLRSLVCRSVLSCLGDVFLALIKLEVTGLRSDWRSSCHHYLHPMNGYYQKKNEQFKREGLEDKKERRRLATEASRNYQEQLYSPLIALLIDRLFPYKPKHQVTEAVRDSTVCRRRDMWLTAAQPVRCQNIAQP